MYVCIQVNALQGILPNHPCNIVSSEIKQLTSNIKDAGFTIEPKDYLLSVQMRAKLPVNQQHMYLLLKKAELTQLHDKLLNKNEGKSNQNFDVNNRSVSKQQGSGAASRHSKGGKKHHHHRDSHHHGHHKSKSKPNKKKSSSDS